MKSTIKDQVKQCESIQWVGGFSFPIPHFCYWLIYVLADAAVEEILQEAAEAFAIERAKQEMEHTYPSVKEITSAVRILY